MQSSKFAQSHHLELNTNMSNQTALQQAQTPPPLPAQDTGVVAVDTDDYQNRHDIDQLLAAYVGEKYGTYYRKKWFKDHKASLDISNTHVLGHGFNIASFFLGLLWLGYRKMYFQAAMIMLFISVLDLGLMYVLGNEIYPMIDSISYTAIWIILGFVGNYLYLEHSTKQVKKAIAESADHEMAAIQLEEVGGTSWLMSIAVTIVLFALSVLSTYLFAPAWYWLY